MRARPASVALLASASFVLGVLFSLPSRAQDDAGAAAPVPACNEQQPQDFLVRGNWQTKARMPAEEQRERRARAAQAIRYRTEHYGFFEGFGQAEWNAHPPSFYARWTTAFGLRVRLNERVLPALRCAEAAIASSCTATPYAPHRLSGLRDRNTYHNGEVSNHVYGIAIDIDPDTNTCCHCVAEWAEHPLCRREVASIFERMSMPECWVTQFERYGWYWLGHDQLQDTMHFEFLGDADRILATP